MIKYSGVLFRLFLPHTVWGVNGHHLPGGVQREEGEFFLSGGRLSAALSDGAGQWPALRAQRIGPEEVVHVVLDPPGAIPSSEFWAEIRGVEEWGFRGRRLGRPFPAFLRREDALGVLAAARTDCDAAEQAYMRA